MKDIAIEDLNIFAKTLRDNSPFKIIEEWYTLFFKEIMKGMYPETEYNYNSLVKVQGYYDSIDYEKSMVLSFSELKHNKNACMYTIDTHLKSKSRTSPSLFFLIKDLMNDANFFSKVNIDIKGVFPMVESSEISGEPDLVGSDISKETFITTLNMKFQVYSNFNTTLAEPIRTIIYENNNIRGKSEFRK